MKRKNKTIYIFYLFVFVATLFSFLLYDSFKKTREAILTNNFQQNFNSIEEMTRDIYLLVVEKIKDSPNLLSNEISKKRLETTIRPFLRGHYVAIYIVKKLPNDSYDFVVGVSKNGEYNLLSHKQALKGSFVIEKGENNSFKISYYMPFSYSKENYLLVTDTALKDKYLALNRSLDKIDNLLKIVFLFSMLFFATIIWLLALDIKRERELEKRVREEIEKNRKKDEQILYQSKLAKMGEMMSMIAHQWRQPLATISSIVLSLKFKMELNSLDEKTLKTKLNNIGISVDYLSKTIDDFRDFFKIHKERDKTTFQEVLKPVLEIANLSLLNKNIDVIVKLDYNKPIYIYSNELKQVILNILKNSEDVMIERDIKNRKIEIRTFKKGNKIFLLIADNGGGVEQEIIDKIFDPYFSTKDSKNGTGLGLYMSKIIIEKHLKGELIVENRGGGAVFKIILDEGEVVC